jgi:hypothetical protein
MNAPLFRVLSKTEYRKLSLQQRLEYMQALISDVARKMEVTKREIERSKAILATHRLPK